MNSNGSYAFGVSEFTTMPWPFERDVKSYAAHGVDCIEVCEAKLRQSNPGAQLELIDKANLRVSSVQTRVHSLFPDSLAPTPENPAERLNRIAESMERIAPYVPEGTPFVVITGAAPHGDCALVYDYSIAALRWLAGLAASHRMRIAFEPLNPILFNTDTALWGLDRALELVERVARPELGLCVDTWNIFQTPDVERVIARCAGKIFLVQVSDWRRPHSNADRRSLGDGIIPTADLVKAIRRTGYAGPYVLEIFSSEWLSDSLWNGDLDDSIERNITAFRGIWQHTETR